MLREIKSYFLKDLYSRIPTKRILILFTNYLFFEKLLSAKYELKMKGG